jgi:uncharacterized protein (TIRG00374 family)
VGVAALVVVVRFVVVPQYASAVTALRSLESLSVPLVVLALLLEMASLAVFSAMTWTVLGFGRPSYPTLVRIDLVDLGVNHIVPGGGTTSAAVRFGLLKRVGVPGPDALTGAAIEVLASNLMLGLVFASGLLLSITRGVGSSSDVTAILVVGALFAFVAFVVWMLSAHVAASTRVVRAIAGRLPLVTPEAAERLVLTMSARLRDLVESPRRLLMLALLGAGNWLFDAAALWVVLAAFGAHLGLGPLLTVYGLGSILAMLPLTPGGLGIVEGVMVPVLVVFGVPADLALLGVVGWRLLEYWLPIPLAAAAYLSLRFTVLSRRGRAFGGRP